MKIGRKQAQTLGDRITELAAEIEKSLPSDAEGVLSYEGIVTQVQLCTADGTVVASAPIQAFDIGSLARGGRVNVDFNVSVTT